MTCVWLIPHLRTLIVRFTMNSEAKQVRIKGEETDEDQIRYDLQNYRSRNIYIGCCFRTLLLRIDWLIDLLFDWLRFLKSIDYIWISFNRRVILWMIKDREGNSCVPRYGIILSVAAGTEEITTPTPPPPPVSSASEWDSNVDLSMRSMSVNVTNWQPN